MLFRLRIYSVEPGRLAAFNQFFLERLLPIQVRHGARLVGRFESANEHRIFALWAYDDQGAYERIDHWVRDDPDSAAARRERESLAPLVSDVTEDFVTTTVPLALTELAHLGTSCTRMGRYVVIREPGSAWDPSRPMREQDGWNEHAAFMDGLAEDGFIVLGGPLDGTESEFLHVVDAESEDEIKRRFAADPWAPSDMLRLKRVSAWEILLRRPD